MIEIMIVMFLIAMITGVVAYNYRGSLDEGKSFKTKAGIEKLENILNMAVSEDPYLLNDIESNWKQIIDKSPLVKDKEALKKDGWGYEYNVTVNGHEVEVESKHRNAYEASKKNR